jgi:excinuclease UvrABC ATPase subunit
MTDKQKKEQITMLYGQLDKLGQLIAEDDEYGADRAYYNREYRRTVNALRKLEPEKWSCYPLFRQKTTEGRNEMVAKYLSEHRCPNCNGELKQTRSGAFRVVCQQCGKKWQLKRNKR